MAAYVQMYVVEADNYIHIPIVQCVTNGLALRITSSSVYVWFIKRLLCKLICGVTISNFTDSFIFFLLVDRILPKRLFEKINKIKMHYAVCLTGEIARLIK